MKNYLKKYLLCKDHMDNSFKWLSTRYLAKKTVLWDECAWMSVEMAADWVALLLIPMTCWRDENFLSNLLPGLCSTHVINSITIDEMSNAQRWEDGHLYLRTCSRLGAMFHLQSWGIVVHVLYLTATSSLISAFSAWVHYCRINTVLWH